MPKGAKSFPSLKWDGIGTQNGNQEQESSLQRKLRLINGVQLKSLRIASCPVCLTGWIPRLHLGSFQQPPNLYVIHTAPRYVPRETPCLLGPGLRLFSAVSEPFCSFQLSCLLFPACCPSACPPHPQHLGCCSGQVSASPGSLLLLRRLQPERRNGQSTPPLSLPFSQGSHVESVRRPETNE